MQESELEELLREYEEGVLKPLPVPLGKVPPPPVGNRDMERVADHMRLLLGLKLAVGDHRPLPYSFRFAASKMGWGHHRRAERAIRALCEEGVIERAGELKPIRGRRQGTKLYAPPLPADERQAGDVGVEAVGPFEPVHEQGEHRGVHRAVDAERLNRGAASGNAATGGGHATDPTPYVSPPSGREGLQGATISTVPTAKARTPPENAARTERREQIAARGADGYAKPRDLTDNALTDRPHGARS